MQRLNSLRTLCSLESEYDKKRIINRVTQRMPLMIIQMTLFLVVITLLSSNYNYVAEAQQTNNTNGNSSPIGDAQKLENFTGSPPYQE